MSRHAAGYGLLALLVGALLAQGAAERARAQGAPPPSGARWEYRVFRLDPADYGDKADWRAILDESRGNALRAEAPFYERVLNFLGDDGWELVTAERRAPNLLHLYLKRPAR